MHTPSNGLTQGTMFEFEESVCVMNSEGKLVEVGHVKKPTGQEIHYDLTDTFKRADTYSEEVRGKGSGLGFSSFMHLAATPVCAGDIGIVEPLDGFDVELTPDDKSVQDTYGRVTGLTIEVTGTNYRSRPSPACWTVNKYELLQPLRSSYPRYSELSRKEETLNPFGFIDSGLCTEVFPYSQDITNIMFVMSRLTETQLEGLGRYTARWYNTTAVKTPDVSDEAWLMDKEAIGRTGMKHFRFPFCTARCLLRIRVRPSVKLVTKQRSKCSGKC